MKAFYNYEVEDLMNEFSSELAGLSDPRVEKNREEFGENKLEEKARRSLFSIFAEQFKDLLVIILIIAALISASTGVADRKSVV